MSFQCIIAQEKQDASLKSLDDLLEYTTVNSGLNISDGDYFKDTNNRLDPYLGQWQGSYDNKNLTLEISKLVKSESIGYYKDILLIKYSLVDNQGQVLVNTLDMFDNYSKHINGMRFLNEFNLYVAIYSGLQSNCNQKGWAYIEKVNNTTLKFWIKPDSGEIIPNDCPDGNIHILPTSEATAVTLTKQ
jgi:hypothetical protein